MIIVNNNNNNNSSGLYLNSTHSDRDITSLLAFVFQKDKKRHDAIRLAFAFGWCGLHRFYLRQWVYGIIHLLLLLFGICGTVLIFYSFFVMNFTGNWLFYMSIVFFCCLPATVLLAVGYGVYWTFHTEDEFQKSFTIPEGKPEGNEIK